MGKIIGIGGGFNNEDEAKLAGDIMEMTGKAVPNYLQIPTTGYDSPDIHSVAYYSKMGCNTDILYLTHAYMTEEIIRQKIENADMIYVPGGNLKFVADTWRKTGADKYLKKAFDDGKVLFGSSSGSMCWFRQGFDDCGPQDSFMFVDALGLLPYNNVPHYEGAFWQTFNEYANKTPLSSICCENDTAIQYIDGKWSLRIAANRPDARVWFFDAQNGYRRFDLRSRPDLLEQL